MIIEILSSELEEGIGIEDKKKSLNSELNTEKEHSKIEELLRDDKEVQELKTYILENRRIFETKEEILEIVGEDKFKKFEVSLPGSAISKMDYDQKAVFFYFKNNNGDLEVVDFPFTESSRFDKGSKDMYEKLKDLGFDPSVWRHKWYGIIRTIKKVKLQKRFEQFT